MFYGQQLLCAYLRPSRIDGVQHAAAILKLLVQRLRCAWPQVRIVFRGDSGFCRQRILNYCERAGVHYIVGLFATRTSCHVMRSNQLRVLLAALGYVLIERLRTLALQGTALASAQVDTLRVRLLKVAAVVTPNTRRIRLYLASNWPSADIFLHAMRMLRSP